jgi:methylmalonyl-CoA/ethylmalonyl-CoA epimerase
MNINYVEHIGIAVKDLNFSIEKFKLLLGTECYLIEEIADQNVITAFFQCGGTKIELLQSTSETGPISSFIEKNGEGIHHIAFAVNDTNDTLMQAKKNGFRTIDNIARKGAENLNIGFLNPKSTFNVLIEFCSK